MKLVFPNTRHNFLYCALALGKKKRRTIYGVHYSFTV